MKSKNELNEPALTYGLMGSKDLFTTDVFRLVQMVREGIAFNVFTQLIKKIPFSIQEWSHYLHLSERTMQRYQKEEKTFDVTHSERIVQIAMLYNYGITVFGSQDNFDTWLSSKSIALASKPKDLLDNVFGIELVNDELSKIEHGVFA